MPPGNTERIIRKWSKRFHLKTTLSNVVFFLCRCEFNLGRVLNCIDITRRVSTSNTDSGSDIGADICEDMSGDEGLASGVMQLKVTALVPPAIVARLNLVLKNMNEDQIIQAIQGTLGCQGLLPFSTH